MYGTRRNQDIISLLLRLKAFEREYPFGMFSFRRSTFLMLISRYLGMMLFP